MECQVAGSLAGLPREESPSMFLRVRKRIDGKAVGLAGIVGGAKRLVVLAPGISTESGNPGSSFGAAPISDCAAFGDYRPVRLPSRQQACARGSGVKLGIAHGACHISLRRMYGKRTERM
jgi:hypothetical protein